jgi:hypothetical protein
MQIYKNPFKVKADALQATTNKSTSTDRAKALFRHRSHSERHRATNISSIFLSYICNVLSGLTTAIAIGLVLYKTLLGIGHLFALTTAFLSALVVIPIIETIKRHSLKESLTDAIQYKSINFGMWATTILFCSISVLASYFGAKNIPTLTSSEPTLVNIDSIRYDYNQRIKAATTLHTYKPTNTLTKKGAAIIADMETEKRTVIEDAKNINKMSLDSHTEAQTMDSRMFMGIALGIELLFLVSVLFSMNFYWRCYLETIEDGTEPEPTRINFEKIVQDTSGQRPPTPTSKIGFIIGENTGSTKIVHNSKSRNCVHCGKEYTYKHWKQKFCSTDCRMDYWKIKRKEKSQNSI